MRTADTEPDVRPLGFIAIGLAVLALLLAPTYLLTPWAYVPAVPAVALGLVSRSDVLTRRLGTFALVITLTAVVCATVVLMTY